MMVRSAFFALLAFWASVWSMGTQATAQDVSDEQAARFLLQASFGPEKDSIRDVQRRGYVGWLKHQMSLPRMSVAERVQESRWIKKRNFGEELIDLFWEQALFGEDQLRQRMRFALSQIVVASLADTVTSRHHEAYLDYVDLLDEEALGNYCSLVRRVSFQPTMALYLTYYKNQKADEERGIFPDENYARELMQLFTIGLEELELDGTSTGVPTYDQDDVSGLASVFTGLALAGEGFESQHNIAKPFRGELVGYPEYHETSEKRFLGTVVGPGDDAVASVHEALDHLLAHPNVAPFISKQLIQRLVSSNPSPDYIERVARAFNAGRYVAGEDVSFGSGERCDLEATVAAILLDPEARSITLSGGDIAGKVREPIIRAIHIMRVVSGDGEVSTQGLVPNYQELHRDRDEWGRQRPYLSPTVFNFYRPTYVIPGSATEAKGAVAPEAQIMTASHFAAQTTWADRCAVQRRCQINELPPPDLVPFLTIAHKPRKLVDLLDLHLTAGQLDPKTRSRIITALWTIDVRPGPDLEKSLKKRVSLAFSMVTTSPEFMVQQ